MNGSTKRWLQNGMLAIGGLLAARAVWRQMTRYSFENRVVLITGGSRGLGLVLARQFAAEGARLALCARDSEELERARADLQHRGSGDLLTIPCDVTDRADVHRLMERVLDYYGEIDVLVNNAGVIQAGPVQVMTEEDYRLALETHFWGPWYVIDAVLPGMRRRGAGRIVNISSIGGKLSVPHMLPYASSKFALVGLSEGLRAELSHEGIQVTTVCPGLMRTGSPRQALFKGRHRAEFAWFSIGDSLPLLSVSAESAARQILDACRYGQADLIISLPARLAAVFHGVFPGLTSDLLGWVNRLLPGPGGIGERAVKGFESESAWSPSWLTVLTERAAERNNEVR